MSGHVHACALIVGERGVLVRGASGAGKSVLVLGLLDQAPLHGMFARLVGDDRVHLEARHGRLIARGHPAICGQIEQRGSQIALVPHEGATQIHLVVDLLPQTAPLQRLPEQDALWTCVLGVSLPCLSLWTSGSDITAAVAVMRQLHGIEAWPKTG